MHTKSKSILLSRVCILLSYTTLVEYVEVLICILSTITRVIVSSDCNEGHRGPEE